MNSKGISSVHIMIVVVVGAVVVAVGVVAKFYTSAAAADFSISASPTSGSVQQGGSTAVGVNVGASGDYSFTVSLGVSGGPLGVSVVFGTGSDTPPFSTTVTISVGSDVPPGTYTLTIIGSGEDGKVRLTSYTLTVTSAPTASIVAGTIRFSPSVPAEFGVERIYLMKYDSGYDKSTNLSQYVGKYNCLATIGSGDSIVAIPANELFDIVVAAVGTADDMMSVRKDYIRIELLASGHFTITENSPDSSEYVFAHEGLYTEMGWLRLNAVWDNNGNGYKLAAGTALHLDSRVFTYR